MPNDPAAQSGTRGAVEILQEARDYLMEHGWWQGSYGPQADDGFVDPARKERCAFGAVDTVCKADENHWSHASDHLFIAFQELYADDAGNTSYIDWNDLPTTTFNDVMALFDEAIRLAKEAA